MVWFGRLNVELSPRRRKLQWIFVKIGQASRFASDGSCVDYEITVRWNWKCQMEYNERLNVEISPTARKLQWIFDEIGQMIAVFEWRGLCWLRNCRAVKLYVSNGVPWAFKPRNIPSGKEITVDFRQNSTNSVLRALGLVSTLKTAWTMLCAQNGVIWAFKRRNIPFGKEITVDFRRNWRIDRLLRAVGLCRHSRQRALCCAHEGSVLGV
jgi:hypothetical protein